MRAIESLKEQSPAGAVDDDESLMLRMLDRDSDPVGAEEALAKFFERHHLHLKSFAEKSGFRTLGFDPEDFVLKTFTKVFTQASQFRAPRLASPEEFTRKVRNWIFEIARNEFLMELRKRANHLELVVDQEPTPPETVENLQLSDRAAAVRTFIENLPEKDRVLMVISMNFFDSTQGRSCIPSDILAGLAESLQTTPEGLKQRRKRIVKQLKNYLTGN